MATVQESRARPKYDDYLEAKLEKARSRVRMADLAAASLSLAAITLAFALVMLLADRAWELPTLVRQGSLVAFLGVAGWYAWRHLGRPLAHSVNPYFAARQVERSRGDSHNSLVSWLDLRDRPLAPSVRDAVGRAAAGELEGVDLEEAVRDPRLGRAGIITGVLAVALVALLCVMRPAQFFSLLARAFAPFGTTVIAKQTMIDILEPAGGNLEVPLNYSVEVRVDVSGRVPRAEEPDALRLRFRYSTDDPVWEEKRLETTDRSGEWAVRVPANQVRNGFEYQVVGGDAATAIHKVTVRARPVFSDYEVRYRYRPYLRMPDDIRAEPNLQAVRGTEAIIRAKTSRPVRDGSLRFFGADKKETQIAGRLVADRPDAIEFPLTLLQNGQYRLRFMSADGEPSDETLPFDVKVIPDQPPEVAIKQQGPDKLPVNGTLSVGSEVTDDFGLTRARLVMSLIAVKDGPPEQLPHRLHQDGKPLKQPDGADPRKLVSKDVVALEKLVDVAGHKLDLKPGMTLIYKYQAEDNCDLPKPQLGESKEYRVVLVEPQDPAQRDQERKQAEQDKREQEGMGQKPNDGQPNPNPEQPKDDGKPGDAGQGQGQDQGNDDKVKEQAQRIADALRNQEKGEGEANPGGAGNPKPDGKPKDGDSKPQPGGESQPGEKDQPQPGGKAGESKPGDNPQPKGESKPGDAGTPPPGGEPKQGNEKPTASPQTKPDTAQPQGKDGDAGPSPAGMDKKPDQINRPGDQRDNKNSTAPDKTQPQDQPQPGTKTGDTPEKKNDGKTEKSGEKPGQGAKQDLPNDTAPKTSPDKGNADGGQPGSQRAGENKGGEKPEKSNDAAMSGKSDPKAGTPEGDKPRGASAEGDKPNNQGQQTKSDAGAAKPNPNANDPTKPQATENAAKPHEQPGAKPNAEPKTDGTPAAADPKAAKPDGKGSPSPSDKPSDGGNPANAETLKKMAEAFRNADPKTQQKILDQLEQMAKDAKTPEERRQIEQACKDCQGGGNAPKPGGQDQPGQKSGAEGSAKKPADSPKAGQPGSASSDDKPGTKPGTAAKPGDQGGAKADPSGQAGDKGRPDPQGQPGDNMPKPGDKPATGEPNNKQAGDGDPTGQRGGDVKSRPTGETPAAPNQDFLNKSGDLQLEDFRKKVDRKLLDRLKMTDEEYREFLKAYEAMLKRQQAEKAGGDDKVRGAGAGGTANRGAKKVEAGPKSGPDTQRGGRGQAPPEYRDQYRDFSSEQSKKEQKK